MTWINFAVVISLLGSCSVQSYEWEQHYEDLKKRYSEKVLSEEHVEEMRPAGFRHPPFQCPDMSPSPSIPTSVEFVKAADIKAVAALGDSLTLLAGSKNVDCGLELGGSKNMDRLEILEDRCGIGANASNVLGIPIEYRDVSYSIGGYGTYEDVITLANILRLFNPNVLGPAPRSTLHGYPATLNDTGLNLAVTGHNTLNFSEQTRNLIETFKVYPGLNFQEDWKLVTVLIGMNDICDHCKNKTLFSVDNFIHYMTEALDMLKDEVPRLIVNVVQILSMEPLRQVKRPTLGCQLQRSFCSCLVLPSDGSPELQEVVELNVEFQRRLEQLLYSDRYFKHDFAVVLQPYLTKAQPARKPDGKLDLSFFAPDCFHFSIKGHEELAKGLWNNMFQPAGEKFMIESFTEPVKLACPPGDHPYIYTRPTAASSLPKLFLPLLALAYLH